MKVLIMGITGFAGSSMYHLLSCVEDINLYGTFRHSTKNRNIADNFSRAVLVECDICDISSLETVLSEIKPDIIFHFISYVSVFGSFRNPLTTFQTNIMGTANLLEAVKKIVPEAKILLPGSAEEYGNVSEDNMPIREDCLLNPVNPYAVSKMVQEEIGFYYFKVHGLNIYFTRTFHYTGPGQPLGFICSDFAKQIVDVENGKTNTIRVGNLDVKRDFVNIRDVITAYWDIVNKGKSGEVYNVCSATSVAIREILNKLMKLSKKDIIIEVDERKLRPSDVPNFVGDNTKLKNIGWIFKCTIDDSLKDLLGWWRNELKRN